MARVKRAVHGKKHRKAIEAEDARAAAGADATSPVGGAPDGAAPAGAQPVRDQPAPSQPVPSPPTPPVGEENQ